MQKAIPQANIGKGGRKMDRLILITFDGGTLPNKYGYGYITGKEKDLLCVKLCKTNQDAEVHLSPISASKIMAVIGFILKWLLSRFDENMVIWGSEK
jgi:hypothetical protein